MLYRETSTGFSPWNGERIGGVLYPLTIEQQWKAPDLAALGLHRPQPADPVPSDKIATETHVERVDGVVRYVNTVADKPVPDVITPKQAKLALLKAGLLGQVEAMIEALPDPDKKVVEIEWNTSQTIRRDHMLIATLAEKLPLSDAQVDNLFKQAAEIE